MHQEPEKTKAAHTSGGLIGDSLRNFSFRASSDFSLKAPWRLQPGCRARNLSEPLLMLVCIISAAIRRVLPKIPAVGVPLVQKKRSLAPCYSRRSQCCMGNGAVGARLVFVPALQHCAVGVVLGCSGTGSTTFFKPALQFSLRQRRDCSKQDRFTERYYCGIFE